MSFTLRSIFASQPILISSRDAQIGFCYILAMFFSNYALFYVNYPTQVSTHFTLIRGRLIVPSRIVVQRLRSRSARPAGCPPPPLPTQRRAIRTSGSEAVTRHVDAPAAGR
jgi:hypothetical protein